MTKLVGFGKFADLPEERIGEKISRRILSGDQEMLVWWSIKSGVHVESHSHANEQIVWMLKGKMEFRLGTEQRVCGPGDVVLIAVSSVVLIPPFAWKTACRLIRWQVPRLRSHPARIARKASALGSAG